MRSKRPALTTSERKQGARTMRQLTALPVLDEYHPHVHFLAFCEPCGEMESCTLYITETSVTHDQYALFLCADCESALRFPEPANAR